MTWCFSSCSQYEKPCWWWWACVSGLFHLCFHFKIAVSSWPLSQHDHDARYEQHFDTVIPGWPVVLHLLSSTGDDFCWVSPQHRAAETLWPLPGIIGYRCWATWMHVVVVVVAGEDVAVVCFTLTVHASWYTNQTHWLSSRWDVCSSNDSLIGSQSQHYGLQYTVTYGFHLFYRAHTWKVPVLFPSQGFLDSTDASVWHVFTPDFWSSRCTFITAKPHLDVSGIQKKEAITNSHELLITGLSCSHDERVVHVDRGTKKSLSPALWDTHWSPATSPSTTPVKHIWTPNNSFRFLRLALLLRRFSITPPPTAVSGIPSTPTRAMVLFSRAAFRRKPRWWSKGPSKWGEVSAAAGGVWEDPELTEREEVWPQRASSSSPEHHQGTHPAWDFKIRLFR